MRGREESETTAVDKWEQYSEMPWMPRDTRAASELLLVSFQKLQKQSAL